MTKIDDLGEVVGELYQAVEALEKQGKKLQAEPEVIQAAEELGRCIRYIKKNDVLEWLKDGNLNTLSNVNAQARVTYDEAKDTFDKAMKLKAEFDEIRKKTLEQAGKVEVVATGLPDIVNQAENIAKSRAAREATNAAQNVANEMQNYCDEVKGEARENQRIAAETLDRAQHLVDSYDPEAGYSWRQIRKTGKTVGIGLGIGAAIGSALVYLCMPEPELIMIKEEDGYTFDPNKKTDTALWETNMSGKIKRDKRGKEVVYGGRFDNGDIETGDRIKKIIQQQKKDVREGRIPELRDIVSSTPTYVRKSRRR